MDNADGDDDLTTGVDNPWDFGEDDQYPALKADTNNDGIFTWHEFGDQGRVDHPDVSITANQPAVTEGQTARFTVSITPASATAVTVNLLVAAHLDYGVAVGPATVVIQANAPSAIFTVTTTNNDVDQHAGRMTVTVLDGTGYDASASSATVTINDNDERGVTISKSAVTVAENAGTAQYTVVLTSEPTANVTVTPSVTGPATFSPASLAFTTGNWNAAQTVTVTGQNDDIENPGNRRTATITHAVSGGDYTGETAAAVTVTVIDDEGPVPAVSITANRTSVTEGGDIVFTITGDQAPGGDVPVSLRVVVADDNGGGGTTTETATIPANGLRATLTVTTMNDELDETGSSVTVTVMPGAGYDVGSPATAVVKVNDNDLSGVSIEAVNSLNGPGGAAEFRLTATTMQERALRVRVRITSTGVTGVSRNRTVTVTIPRGRATAVYSVAIPENSPDGTVTATLLRGSGYTIDPAPATVDIVDRALIARPSFEAGKPAVTTRESVSRPGEIALHIAPGRNPNSEHASSLRYEWTQVSGPASTFLQGSIYRDGNSIDGSQRFRGGELYYPVTQSGDVVIYRVSGCETMRTVTVPAGTAIVNTQGVTITEANEVVYEIVKPDSFKRTPLFRLNSPGGAFHWWRFVHDQDDDGEWIAVAVSGGGPVFPRYGTLGRISEPFCKTDAQGRKVGASPTGDYMFRLTVWDQTGASHFAVITATVTDTLPPVAAAKVTSVYQAARDSQLLCSTEPDAPIRCGNSDTPDTLDTSNLVQEPGSTVRLSGRDSRTNVGGRLTYSWEQTCDDSSSGRVIRVVCPVPVTLRGANTATPSFTAPDQEIDLSFTLTVTDKYGNRGSDTVYLTIEEWSPEIQIKPQAHAVVNYPVDPAVAAEGRETEAAREKTRVTLDGRGSNDDLDNGRITYLWAPLDGIGNGRLTGATRSRATFLTPTGLTGDAAYRFQLTVTDNDDKTDTAEVEVRVTAAPTVDSFTAPEVVEEGAAITLRARASGYPGEQITYEWTEVITQTTGAPVLTLPADKNSATLRVTAPTGLPTNAFYRFTVKVVDSDGLPATDDVFVQVRKAAPPQGRTRVTANAGPNVTVTVQAAFDEITLSGAGATGPADSRLYYEWTQVSGPRLTVPGFAPDGPNDALIWNAGSLTPIIPAPERGGRVTLRLRVEDDFGGSASDTVTITIRIAPPEPEPTPEPPPEPPPGPTPTPEPTPTPSGQLSANAGPDRTVAGGRTVRLEGSATAPPGGRLSYEWTKVSGPELPWPGLANANFRAATFFAPDDLAFSETATFKFTVTDDNTGQTATDTVTITIQTRRNY